MDHVGYFGSSGIIALLIGLLVAAGCGWGLAVLGFGLRGREGRELAVWAAVAALGVGFVRGQLPLALALVAIALFATAAGAKERNGLARACAMVIGLGCGSGASLVTLVAMVPLLFIVRWACATREHTHDR